MPVRLILLSVVLLLTSAFAHALDVKPYSPAALMAAQQANQPVALHFHADWCPTCAAQSKVLEQLKADASLKDMSILVVNYDKETALKREMKIRTQSTLVVFKGAQEVARSSGQTQAEAVKAILSKAL